MLVVMCVSRRWLRNGLHVLNQMFHLPEWEEVHSLWRERLLGLPVLS